MLLETKPSCTGCHACMNICPRQCISMTWDEEGFLYPQVNINVCEKCNLCRNVCPALNAIDRPVEAVGNKPYDIQKKSENLENSTHERLTDAYACWNLNEKMRMDSSSGGVFTLLAQSVLRKGGIVYGAAFREKHHVEHIGIEEEEDIALLRGSKYVQSQIGNSFRRAKKNLDTGRLVYFSGTPCQIEGLQSYLRNDYDNLICQDIVCYGVPSPKLWDHYLEQFELEDDAQVRFRDKSTGWDTYSFTIEQKHRFSELASENIYMKTFLANLCLRPSCYKCRCKSLVRRSDITLADFWGVKEVCPEMYDNKGTSLVFVNSWKGECLLQEISQSMKIQRVDREQAAQYNPASFRSADLPTKRESFMNDVYREPFQTVACRYTKDPFVLRMKKKMHRIMKGK